MERGFILLIATVIVFVAPGVRGTSHLSFANNTEVNITRTGCGVSKLCVETPDDCDPAKNATCLFASVIVNTTVAPNGSELSFELSGNSTGYIALGLTVNASEGTTMLFVCAQNSSNNGSFFFRTVLRNNSNNMLYPAETRVKEIRGLVNGDVIQCEFDVPNVNASNMRSMDTTFTVLLGYGVLNGSDLGSLSITLNTGRLNLADLTSNITTTAAPTTTTTAASGSGALHPHAAPLLLSALMLYILKTA